VRAGVNASLDARGRRPYLSTMSDGSAASVRDPRTAAAIAALRARVAERMAAIVEDLEAIHEVIEEARRLTHRAEDFEALEAIDSETWQALDALRAIAGRSGLLPPGTS
jgi:hypothetical protein